MHLKNKKKISCCLVLSSSSKKKTFLRFCFVVKATDAHTYFLFTLKDCFSVDNFVLYHRHKYDLINTFDRTLKTLTLIDKTHSFTFSCRFYIYIYYLYTYTNTLSNLSVKYFLLRQKSTRERERESTSRVDSIILFSFGLKTFNMFCLS